MSPNSILMKTLLDISKRRLTDAGRFESMSSFQGAHEECDGRGRAPGTSSRRAWNCVSSNYMRVRFLNMLDRVFARLNTAEYRETAPPISRLGTGADTGPGAFLLLPTYPRRFRMLPSPFVLESEFGRLIFRLPFDEY